MTLQLPSHPLPKLLKENDFSEIILWLELNADVSAENICSTLREIVAGMRDLEKIYTRYTLHEKKYSVSID